MTYFIYVIETDGFWYVGSTRNVRKRLEQHMTGRGGAPLVWAKVQELGRDSFNFRVLEECSDRASGEQKWYDRLILTSVASSLNSRRPFEYPECTPERNAKLSAALKGREFSSEHRKNISNALMGRSVSRSARANMSVAQKKRVITEVHRAKIVGSLRGLTRSPEERARIRDRSFNRLKSRCRAGHLFSDENTRVRATGGRRCLECERQGQHRRRASKF